MAKKKTRLAELQEAALKRGLHVSTYSPGDGVTRYRFFDKPGNSYFGPDNGIYTALGLKEAWAYVYGVQASSIRRDPGGKKRNREGLTWEEWKNAANIHTSAGKRAWERGEDPSDWRAARVQSYPRMPNAKGASRYTKRDPGFKNQFQLRARNGEVLTHASTFLEARNKAQALLPKYNGGPIAIYAFDSPKSSMPRKFAEEWGLRGHDPRTGGARHRRDPDAPWRQKAHRVIAALSKESYEQMNRRPEGGRYKRHRPYSVPETAQKLIDALNRNDEAAAKAIFTHDYDALRVVKGTSKDPGTFGGARHKGKGGRVRREVGSTGAAVWHLPGSKVILLWPGPGARLQFGFNTPGGTMSHVHHPTADSEYRTLKDAEAAVRRFLKAK